MYTNIYNGEVTVSKVELVSAYCNLTRKLKMEKGHWDFIRETLKRDNIKSYDAISENEFSTLITVLSLRLYK